MRPSTANMIHETQTAAINTSPYFEDISLILSRHRNEDSANASVLRLETPATLLLYVVGGKAVSSLRYFETQNGNVYVNLVHTLEEHRGKGYSRKLFNHLFNKTIGKNIELEVESNNTPAVSLYASLGFKPTGVNYFGDVVMLR